MMANNGGLYEESSNGEGNVFEVEPRPVQRYIQGTKANGKC